MSAGNEELERLLFATQSTYGDEASKGMDRIRALFAECEEFAAKVALQSCAHCGVEYAQMAVESHMRCPDCRMAEREAQVAALRDGLEKARNGTGLSFTETHRLITDTATVAREHDARIEARVRVEVLDRVKRVLDQALIPGPMSPTAAYTLQTVRAELQRLAEGGTT